ncbi:BTB/POZ and MATH domain-containing protein 2-like [Lolium rigidum]|uniref:BTB/POZ and MATH domain-containing protein 2-like n=1 Tax=Lolium rigidum TaxID=89674 RepID=UPI001F5DCCC2|nr:BTB/POZ and MATH domain-containing protein 2-like [Lolium rigidum]
MANSSSLSSSGGEHRSRTASAIVARAGPVSGCHDLKIDGYSNSKGLGNSNFIASEAFGVGGRRWRLQYYPDGFYGYPEWISFYLCLDSEDENPVNVQFQISLLDHDGNPVPEYTKVSRTCDFSKKRKTMMYGFVQFIRATELEESVYLKDDIFSVQCDMTVPQKVYTEPIPASDGMAPPHEMFQHLGQLLSTGEGADVTFEVGGEMIPAHRCIIARSSVFRAELLGPMKEKTDACIRLDGIEARVFKAMLHFVYTNSFPHIDVGDEMAMAQHLLVLADRYNLGRLKLICEDMLHRYIDTSTVATTLTLAEQHGCGGLKNACLKFLGSRENFNALMASNGFEHLTRSCPSLLKNLDANLAD